MGHTFSNGAFNMAGRLSDFVKDSFQNIAKTIAELVFC
jgi:hypothetical protein